MTAFRPPIKPSPRPARARLGITTGVGALAASLLAIALGTNAFASIPGPGGIISGCYVKTGGALSVIDSTQKCASNQTSVNWNQIGPPGPSGSAGANGAIGAIGPAGPIGPVGATGVDGAPGATGPTGAVGPTGPAGATNLHVRVGLFTVPSGTSPPSVDLTQSCNTGEVATSGGFQIYSTDGVQVLANRPQGPSGGFPPGPPGSPGEIAPTAWQVRVANTTQTVQNVDVWVVCALS